MWLFVYLGFPETDWSLEVPAVFRLAWLLSDEGNVSYQVPYARAALCDGLYKGKSINGSASLMLLTAYHSQVL